MTESSILPTNAFTTLSATTDPAEASAIEVKAKLARAYAKETKNYELLVNATKLYVLSRRKVTELIQPYIRHGGQGPRTATLLDYGFTKQQWNRRVHELDVPIETVEGYFDECISNGWQPSLYDLMRRQSVPVVVVVHEEWCNVNLGCNCKAEEK